MENVGGPSLIIWTLKSRWVWQKEKPEIQNRTKRDVTGFEDEGGVSGARQGDSGQRYISLADHQVREENPYI
jgi:hypothetical protein